MYSNYNVIIGVTTRDGSKRICLVHVYTGQLLQHGSGKRHLIRIMLTHIELLLLLWIY